jgi:hypothetical protein
MVLNWKSGCRAPGDMFRHLTATGWLTGAEGDVLIRAHARLEAFQQLARLALDGEFSPERAGRGLCALIARTLGERSMEAVSSAIRADSRATASIIAARLGP